MIQCGTFHILRMARADHPEAARIDVQPDGRALLYLRRAAGTSFEYQRQFASEREAFDHAQSLGVTRFDHILVG